MPEPVRDLFVHVGLPKTGTTYLQETLFLSKEKLLAHGFDLIPRSRRANFWLMLVLRDKFDPAVEPKGKANAVAEFESELASSTAQTVVMSDERFARLSAPQVDRLAAAAPGFQLHLVITLRSISRVIPSAWQQRVKAGITLSLDQFIAELHAGKGQHAKLFWAGRDLVTLLGNWAAHVPPERVHVCTMPLDRTTKPTLLERFCRAIGAPAEVMTEPEKKFNAAIGRHQTELLRLVNQVSPEDHVAREGHGRRNPWHVRLTWLGIRHLGAQSGEPLTMPTEWQTWCDTLAQRDIEFLAESGVQLHGDLADLKCQDDDFSDTPPPTEHELLMVAARALSGMVAERAEEKHTEEKHTEE
jgi:hypothetical protein